MEEKLPNSVFKNILGNKRHILFCFPLPDVFTISNNQFKIYDI